LVKHTFSSLACNTWQQPKTFVHIKDWPESDEERSLEGGAQAASVGDGFLPRRKNPLHTFAVQNSGEPG
jgi:hypothetical protein